jgi:uracil-DNA glycosylase
MPKAGVILLGEAWGRHEAILKQAFVGTSGVELLKMLHEAKLIRFTSADYNHIRAWYQTENPSYVSFIWEAHPELYRTNVFNLHPPSNDLEAICTNRYEALPGWPALVKGKYAPAELAPELQRLAAEIHSVEPNLIVCLGNTALWALTGRTGIGELRGSTRASTHLVSGVKLLPTYHPAAVGRQRELWRIVVADLIKANRERKFPEVRRPHREVWIEPTLADLEEFYERHIRPEGRVSVDIETSGRLITCIGFSPRPDIALVVPFHDSRRKDRNYWPHAGDEKGAWDWVSKVLRAKDVTKVFQNGAYDVSFLLRSNGLVTYGMEHDTMLLHHALYPEMLKGLGFLGSLYTDEGSWKEMRKVKTIKRDD